VQVARNADGSDTCKGDAGNYVLAKIKNSGQVAAGQFTVRLAVNGNLKQEQVYVQGLSAGPTIDVKLPTDDLNSGPQSVKVLADGDNEVSESDEGNNGKEVTADCD
jgi:subtilase family serine protease